MSPELVKHMSKNNQVIICERQVVFKTKKRRKFEDKGTVLDAPQRVQDFLAAIFEKEPYEKFYAIAVDSENRFLGMILLAEGTVNRAPVFPRKLMTFLLLETSATGVILAHNHPGGDIKASSQDIQATRNFIKILDPMDINVLDHIIYADGEWLSMKEEGLV